MFLAGGSTVTNVSQSIARVWPFAFDVCSGIRSNGPPDARKLAAFVAAVCAADQLAGR